MSRRATSVLVAAALTLALVGGLVAALVRGDDAQTGPGSTPLPGIDRSTAKVGYLVSDHGRIGFSWYDGPGAAEVTAAIEAVVDHVNANGGAGGRRLVPEIVRFDAANASAEQSAGLCGELTGEHGVFAAALEMAYHASLACYADANTLVIDQTLVARDQAQLEQLAPYAWTPSVPEYGTFLRAQLEHLRDQGFLAPGLHVQILRSNGDVPRRAVESVAEPFLADLGVDDVRVDEIDITRTDTIGMTAKQALIAGKRADVDRLVVIGGDRVLPIAMSDFEARGFEAGWAISTFDNPEFVEANSASLITERREGMVGLGFDPSADVAHARGPSFPDPDNATQQRCHEILTAAGAFPRVGAGPDQVREMWRRLLQACDSTLFLAAALDNVGPGDEVTAQDFAAGVARLGDTLPSATGLRTTWAPGRYAGVDTVRPLRWDDECDCFEYAGDPIVLPDPVVD